jgi:hypothetical protein
MINKINTNIGYIILFVYIFLGFSIYSLLNNQISNLFHWKFVLASVFFYLVAFTVKSKNKYLSYAIIGYLGVAVIGLLIKYIMFSAIRIDFIIIFLIDISLVFIISYFKYYQVKAKDVELTLADWSYNTVLIIIFSLYFFMYAV